MKPSNSGLTVRTHTYIPSSVPLPEELAWIFARQRHRDVLHAGESLQQLLPGGLGGPVLRQLANHQQVRVNHRAS